MNLLNLRRDYEKAKKNNTWYVLHVMIKLDLNNVNFKCNVTNVKKNIMLNK